MKYHILLERFQVIFSLIFKRKFAPKIGVHTDDEKIQKPWGGVQSQIFGVIKRGRKNIYRVHRTSSPDWVVLVHKCYHYSHSVFSMRHHVSKDIYTQGKCGGILWGHDYFFGKFVGSPLLFGKICGVTTTFWENLWGHHYFLEKFVGSWLLFLLFSS